MRRYPALTLLAATPVFVAAYAYLVTHQWWFHPWGMTFAWVAFFATFALMCRAVVCGEWRWLD